MKNYYFVAASVKQKGAVFLHSAKKLIMPTNLNALIRYRTLDECFQNRYGEWTLEKLAERCSYTLDDARGRNNPVSVRTIQDDIRVMRSDILGFNAPIVVKDGIYYYSDPNFSIFNAVIPEEETLREIYDDMLYWWQEEGVHRLEYPLMKMAEVLGETFPPPGMEPRPSGPVVVGAPVAHRSILDKKREAYLLKKERMKKMIYFPWSTIFKIL